MKHLANGRGAMEFFNRATNDAKIRWHAQFPAI